MKLKSILIILLSVFTLAIAFDADAQKNKYKKRRKNSKKLSKYSGSRFSAGRFRSYFYVGGSLNGGNYFGDLAPTPKKFSTDFSFTRPGFGIYGGYRFNHSIAARASLNWVRVYGDDASTDPSINENIGRYARNLSFRNDIKEFQIGVEIWLLPNYGGPNQRLPFNGYIFLGGAVFHHEPMGLVPDFDYQTDTEGDGFFNGSSFNAAPQAGEWVKLRPLETEGVSYKNIDFSIPIAAGATMRIPGTPLNAGIEFGIRYLFTDYIDDVSSNYVDLATLEANNGALSRIMADRSAVPFDSQGNARDLTGVLIQPGADGFFKANSGAGIDGSQRGNPEGDDLIFMTQLKLTYVMGGVIRRKAKYR